MSNLSSLANRFTNTLTKQGGQTVFVLIGPGYIGDVEAFVDVFETQQKAEDAIASILAADSEANRESYQILPTDLK